MILCAAINYKGIIICGHRHSECINVLTKLLKQNVPFDILLNDEYQGFLTSKNRFVDRYEAWKIANDCKQIRFATSSVENDKMQNLISENLY